MHELLAVHIAVDISDDVKTHVNKNTCNVTDYDTISKTMTEVAKLPKVFKSCQI